MTQKIRLPFIIENTKRQYITCWRYNKCYDKNDSKHDKFIEDPIANFYKPWKYRL